MRPWPVTVALRTAGMLCAVSLLAFLVLHAMPGDPVAITAPDVNAGLVRLELLRAAETVA